MKQSMLSRLNLVFNECHFDHAKGSDVDVLACSATISHAKFFEVVAKALDSQTYGPEMAADAAVPLIRFQVRIMYN